MVLWYILVWDGGSFGSIWWKTYLLDSLFVTQRQRLFSGEDMRNNDHYHHFSQVINHCLSASCATSAYKIISLPLPVHNKCLTAQWNLSIEKKTTCQPCPYRNHHWADLSFPSTSAATLYICMFSPSQAISTPFSRETVSSTKYTTSSDHTHNIWF